MLMGMAQRDLRVQFVFSGFLGEASKMVTAPQLQAPAVMEVSLSGSHQISPVPNPAFKTHVSTPLMGPASPASTESLIGHWMSCCFYLWTLVPHSHSIWHSLASLCSKQPAAVSAMFSKFAELLDRGLINTAAKTISDIKADIQNLAPAWKLLNLNLTQQSPEPTRIWIVFMTFKNNLRWPSIK